MRRTIGVALVVAVSWARNVFAQEPAPAGAPPPAAPAAPPPAPTSPAPQPGLDLDQLVKEAETGADDASQAETASEAEDAANRVDVVATQISARAGANAAQTKAAAEAKKKAKTAVAEKQSDESLKKAAEESLCGASSGDPKKPSGVCLVYGMFAASLSVVKVDGEGSSTAGGFFSGQTSHHLTSVAVPFAGLRLLPQIWAGANKVGFVSLDLAGYSAFLTQNLSAGAPATKKIPCSSVASDFTSRLPCEANSPVIPYFGAYVGITVGKSGLAYLTLIPLTIGLAQVGSSPGLRQYWGWSVGALQLNGSF